MRSCDERAVLAIADGGRLATVRGWRGPAERGIQVHPVMVRNAATDTAGLDRLRAPGRGRRAQPPGRGGIPADQASEAHRLLEAGRVRGRLVLDFSWKTPSSEPAAAAW
ncbi:hypothetical protein GCM10009533_44520 [Saccharopolyspora spinosporotrichia]|uniref:Zinc-binding dehydrogenase n=1 Tax=Saccharopolyspora erythraea TaxID=1836 RepID=A0ABN1DDN3_SACER|nr:hypothetical protein N599_28945 [Saccharopolyspora erythraea D]QRK92434.1 hypothetical protein JQX30_14645 [Saccharopolyspora erythraea]